MRAALDHLVVMADTLEQGRAWCEATLGVASRAGGRHPQFGTHNELLPVGGARFPRAYLEVIAVDPDSGNADPGRLPQRWFGMDDRSLRAAVRAAGPRLIHWVARVSDIREAAGVLARRGLDCGPVLGASRMTASGLLQWQITVRPDGQTLMDGCLPTLIQWDGTHPADGMTPAALELLRLELHHPQASLLQGALDALGLQAVAVCDASRAFLQAELATPLGRVTVHG